MAPPTSAQFYFLRGILTCGFFLNLCIIYSPVRGWTDGDDLYDEAPRASLGRSSSEAATDPSPTHNGMKEATSHSAPPANNAGGGPEVSMDRIESSAIEEDVDNRGRQISPVKKK